MSVNINIDTNILSECPICLRPMLQFVIMADGCAIHRICGEEYITKTFQPKGLRTNLPLQNNNLIDNNYANNLIKHLIETTESLNDYVIDLTDDEIYDLKKFITTSPKMMNLLSDRLHVLNKFYLTEITTAMNNSNEIKAVSLLESFLKLPNMNASTFINIPDEKSDTLLIRACRERMSRMCLRLLECENININHVNNVGNNALLYASGLAIFNVVKKLVHLGANPNFSNPIGITPFLFACSIFNEKSISNALFLYEYVNDINQQANNGFTALVCACYHKNISIVDKLLSNPTIKVNLKDNYGKTALYYACSNKLEDIACRLLLMDDNINETNNDNHIYFMIACKNNMKKLCKLLLSGPTINLNLKDNTNNTALHYACFYKLENIACRLVSIVNNINEINDAGYSPLMIACIAGMKKLCKLLLSIPTIKLDLIDNNGKTALHYACSNKLESIACKIVSMVDNLNDIDNEGRTPLMLACTNRMEKLCKILLFNPTIKLNMKDVFGNTALHYAYSNKLENIAQRIESLII